MNTEKGFDFDSLNFCVQSKKVLCIFKFSISSLSRGQNAVADADHDFRF